MNDDDDQKKGNQTQKKDFWDILTASSKFIAAFAGLVASILIPMCLHKSAEKNRNTQIYAEIMSNRERADTDLRAKMFETLFDKYLGDLSERDECSGDTNYPAPKKDVVLAVSSEECLIKNFERKITLLDLLANNFQEYFNAKPIFERLYLRLKAEEDKIIADTRDNVLTVGTNGFTDEENKISRHTNNGWDEVISFLKTADVDLLERLLDLISFDDQMDDQKKETGIYERRLDAKRAELEIPILELRLAKARRHLQREEILKVRKKTAELKIQNALDKLSEVKAVLDCIPNCYEKGQKSAKNKNNEEKKEDQFRGENHIKALIYRLEKRMDTLRKKINKASLNEFDRIWSESKEELSEITGTFNNIQRYIIRILNRKKNKYESNNEEAKKVEQDPNDEKINCNDLCNHFLGLEKEIVKYESNNEETKKVKHDPNDERINRNDLCNDFLGLEKKIVKKKSENVLDKLLEVETRLQEISKKRPDELEKLNKDQNQGDEKPLQISFIEENMDNLKKKIEAMFVDMNNVESLEDFDQKWSHSKDDFSEEIKSFNKIQKYITRLWNKEVKKYFQDKKEELSIENEFIELLDIVIFRLTDLDRNLDKYQRFIFKLLINVSDEQEREKIITEIELTIDNIIEEIDNFTVNSMKDNDIKDLKTNMEIHLSRLKVSIFSIFEELDEIDIFKKPSGQEDLLIDQLKKNIEKIKNRKELSSRLIDLARSTASRQITMLARVGTIRTVSLYQNYKDQCLIRLYETEGFTCNNGNDNDLKPFTYSIDDIRTSLSKSDSSKTPYYSVWVKIIDIKEDNVKIAVKVFRDHFKKGLFKKKLEYLYSDLVEKEAINFWVSYFDMPYMDNTRLYDGSRFAIVLKDLDPDKGYVLIQVASFREEFMSIRDRPLFEEMLSKIKNSKKDAE